MTIRSGKPRRPNWYGSRHNRTIDDLIGMPLRLNSYTLTICSSAPAVNEETNWSLEWKFERQPFRLEYDPRGTG